MEEVSNFCPAMAVPITVKIPEPITAPIPRAVSDTGPNVLFSLRSGSSQSVISLSMDFLAKSWLPRGAPFPVEKYVHCGEVRCETRQAYHAEAVPATRSAKFAVIVAGIF